MGTSTSRYVRKKKTTKSQDERKKRTIKKIQDRDKVKKNNISFDSMNKLK